MTSNQTFAVTPDDAVTLDAGASAPDNQRVFTVATDEAVRVELFAAANVQVDADGVVTFTAAGTSGAAATQAATGTPGAAINQVNGSALISTTGTTASPVNGEVSFRVLGSDNSSYVPVVFTDANTNGTLDIDATMRHPTEDFGIGGATTTLPAEAAAAAGGYAAQQVVILDADAGIYTTSDKLLRCKTGDTFAVNGTAVGLHLFLTHLSGPGTTKSISVDGDTVDVLACNPGGSSSFDITTDIVAAPTDVSASLRNNNQDLRVMFTPPPNFGTDNTDYNIYATEVTDTGDGPVVTVATSVTRNLVIGGVDVGSIVGVSGIDAGKTYRFRVQANAGAATASLLSAPTAGVAIPAAAAAQLNAVASAPVAVTIAVADNDANNRLTSGDVVTITYNEPMGEPAADASITITDGDATATIGSVTNGENATFVRSGSANQVITVTLTGAPLVTQAGTNAGIQFDGSVTAISTNAIVDSTGTAWNISGTPGEIDVPGNAPVDPATLLAGDVTLSIANDNLVGGAGTALPGAEVIITAETGISGVVGLSAVAAADGSFTIDLSGADTVEAADTVDVVQRVQRAAGTFLTSAALTETSS